MKIFRDSSAGRVRVLNVSIDAVDDESLLERVRSARFVVTPNVDHLWNLQNSARFRCAYGEADLVVCDSRVLSLVIRLLFGIRLQAFPGSEFFADLCVNNAGNEGFRLFVLGGTTERHTRLAVQQIRSKYGATVADSYSPPFGFSDDPEHLRLISGMIRASGATHVAVGVGSPKQELVISQLRSMGLESLGFIAVGATIDFESGLVSRAPRALRVARLEWLYRFAVEPKRMFKRYFVHDVQVVWLLLLQRLGLYRAP